MPGTTAPVASITTPSMPTELPLAAAKPDELSVIASAKTAMLQNQRRPSPGGATGKDIFAPLRAMKLHNIQTSKSYCHIPRQ